MTLLYRKLARELKDTAGQTLAIAAVVAAGVAVFVMSLSTLHFLRSTRDAYYDRYRFADVFAQLRRAPRPLVDRLQQIPGVGTVQTRIVVDVTLDVPNLQEPATGRLISLPASGEPQLNQLYLRRGRLPNTHRSEEVLVSEAFFQGNRLQLGDELSAVLNGRLQVLRIVGVALTPEYVFQIKAGDLLPDDQRFGVFWMNQEHLEAAFDMQGAFNDVSLKTLRGANSEEIIDRVDRLLEPYGSAGSYGREDQISASFLDEEIKQLQGMAVVAPIIFLSVAAFLLNVVLTRRIGTQREIIATLKAFGFGNWEIAWHYLSYALLVALFGAILGAAAGSWLASGLAVMYSRFYKFPEFVYRPDWNAVATGVLVSLISATFGGLRAVRQVVKLMPAESMRPAAPSRYRRSLIELLGLAWLVPLTARMILRQLQRRPFSALLSILGIAAAVAVLLMGRFSPDAIDYLIDYQFRRAQRQDLQVVFETPLSSAAAFDIAHLPGVQAVETFRSVPVRMRHDHHEQRTAIMGLGERRDLFRLLDTHERPIRLPPSGLVLSDTLAKLLDVMPGETVDLAIMEGERRTATVPVVGLAREYSGLNGYCNIQFLHRLMREDAVLSGAFLAVDSQQQSELYESLKRTPAVASVAVKQATIDKFRKTVSENILMFQAFNVVFASVIAVGVVYNTARVSLDERSRELSTLRVIGFSRGEVSTILLGELALLTIIAIPIGWLMGYGFCYSMVQGFETEQYRIPLALRPQSFAFAGLVTLATALISGLIVRRSIDRMDLVEVLKSRE